MSLPDFNQLLTLPVGLYIGGIVLGQLLLALWRFWQHQKLQKSRKRQGLDTQMLVVHSLKLRTLRRQAVIEATVWLFTVVVWPFILAQKFANGDNASGATNALGATFATLLLWSLLSGTDVAKAFLGGIAFRIFCWSE